MACLGWLLNLDFAGGGVVFTNVSRLINAKVSSSSRVEDIGVERSSRADALILGKSSRVKDLEVEP